MTPAESLELAYWLTIRFPRSQLILSPEHDGTWLAMLDRRDASPVEAEGANPKAALDALLQELATRHADETTPIFRRSA